METQKKYIITEEEKELLLWNMNNHSIMDAKWILKNLPEFINQEERIMELEKDINLLLEKIMGGIK